MKKFESLSSEKFKKNALSPEQSSNITGGIVVKTGVGGGTCHDTFLDTGCDGTYPASDWISSSPQMA